MKKSFVYCLYILLLNICFCACTKKDVETAQTSVFIAPEEILASPSPLGKGQLLKMDYTGNIIKRKDVNVPASNLQRWVFGNQIRYTYLANDETNPIPNVGYIPGTVIITDTNFNELKRIRLLPYNDHNPLIDALDGHEFILINDDHYIALSYYQKVVNNIPETLHPVTECKVIVPILQEVQNGNVIWEWDGSNYPEFYNTSVENNNFSDSIPTHDYIHLNSIYIDPKDNNLICSLRNLDQVVKIDRKMGKIIWRLGGINSDFPLNSSQKFLRQHCVTLTDKNQTLLIYDNGDYYLRPYTRILEFKLNETNRTITSFKAFSLPNNMFSQFKGSVQKTDSTYFIGTGGTKFMEINYNSGEILLDKDLPASSYRVLKY